MPLSYSLVATSRDTKATAVTEKANKSRNEILIIIFMKKLFLAAFVLLGLVLVSQAQTKHTIGEKFGGGIVFYVDETGEHGLIAEDFDQESFKGGYLEKKLIDDENFLKEYSEYIAENGEHSTEGSEYNDWRLPTNDELSLLLEQSGIFNLDIDVKYWTSDYKYEPAKSEPAKSNSLPKLSPFKSKEHEFSRFGEFQTDIKKIEEPESVRAVRSF